jgi:hypothetical protein
MESSWVVICQGLEQFDHTTTNLNSSPSCLDFPVCTEELLFSVRAGSVWKARRLYGVFFFPTVSSPQQTVLRMPSVCIRWELIHCSPVYRWWCCIWRSQREPPQQPRFPVSNIYTLKGAHLHKKLNSVTAYVGKFWPEKHFPLIFMCCG